MKTTVSQLTYQVIGRLYLVEKLLQKSMELLKLRSLELHVKKVRKRGNKIKKGDKE